MSVTRFSRATAGVTQVEEYAQRLGKRLGLLASDAVRQVVAPVTSEVKLPFYVTGSFAEPALSSENRPGIVITIDSCERYGAFSLARVQHWLAGWVRLFICQMLNVPEQDTFTLAVEWRVDGAGAGSIFTSAGAITDEWGGTTHCSFAADILSRSDAVKGAPLTDL